MSLVTQPSTREPDHAASAPSAPLGSLFPRCGNPRCATGWIRLWRSRRIPVFEGQWACSEKCLEERVAGAVRREMDGRDTPSVPWAHRVPMGLMLVEQGEITSGQLLAALEGQRQEAATGEASRLGEWLLRSGVLSESVLTRALSAQWNCPVFSLTAFEPAEVAAVLPHFLSEAFGAIPVRAPNGRHVDVAFAGRVDRSLCYALERMTGLRVSAGIAQDSEFRRAQQRLFSAQPAVTRHLEAANSWVLVRAMTRWMETVRPAEARLVRVHDYYWLRIWRRGTGRGGRSSSAGVEDMLATVGSGAARELRRLGSSEHESRR